jgi:D-amino peptidase
MRRARFGGVSKVKALIIADMEGISSIDALQQISPFGEPSSYREGCRLMAGDVNAAAEGLLASGVEAVHVRDLHLLHNNLRAEDLIPRVELVQELPEERLAKEYALAVLVGLHRRADNSGFLSHTLMPDLKVRINGEAVGEAELLAWWLGALGIPVALLSGEKGALAEAERRLPGILTVPTKESVSKRSARCLPVEEVHSALREACREAALHPQAFKPQCCSEPVLVEVTYGRKESAKLALEAGLGERRGERTVSKVLADFRAVDNFLDQAMEYTEGAQILQRQPARDDPEALEQWTRKILEYAEAWLTSPQGAWEE